MVRSREDVLRSVQACASALRALGVKRLGLFGSFARGNAGPHSDLDFLVQIEPKTFDAYMSVKLLLEDSLGRSVDLVLENTLKPRLREPILRELIDAPGFERPP